MSRLRLPFASPPLDMTSSGREKQFRSNTHLFDRGNLGLPAPNAFGTAWRRLPGDSSSDRGGGRIPRDVSALASLAIHDCLDRLTRSMQRTSERGIRAAGTDEDQSRGQEARPSQMATIPDGHGRLRRPSTQRPRSDPLCPDGKRRQGSRSQQSRTDGGRCVVQAG